MTSHNFWIHADRCTLSLHGSHLLWELAASPGDTIGSSRLILCGKQWTVELLLWCPICDCFRQENPILDTRMSVLLLCHAHAPTWILKLGGLESSGQRLISSKGRCGGGWVWRWWWWWWWGCVVIINHIITKLLLISWSNNVAVDQTPGKLTDF